MPDKKSSDESEWRNASSPAVIKIRSHETLGSSVYTAISDGLIRGQFRGGDKLRIRELAEFLGTSVTPVRDAVLRLIHDEALVMKTPRDIRVPLLSTKEYLEIRDIRLKIECLAASRAAESATPESISRVEELLRENEAALEQHDIVKAIECNQVFHFMLAELAQMPVLQKVLHMLWLKMGPTISSVYELGGRDMIEEHHEFLKAIRNRDGKAASSAIERDIYRGGTTILGFLEKQIEPVHK